MLASWFLKSEAINYAHSTLTSPPRSIFGLKTKLQEADATKNAMKISYNKYIILIIL